jgi:ferredoxin-NADP reductase
MEYNPVRIKSVDHITHDVIKIVTGKPSGYKYEPGQATDITIDKDGWEEERRPFTFTSLPVNSFLEFTIKVYPSRNGVTKELLSLRRNNVLILHEVFGAITYQGEGTFIAGGAGITPFISIFRHLHTTGKMGQNKLIFANKTKADIILEPEFKMMLGDAFINILSEERVTGYPHGIIDTAFLKANMLDPGKQFYVCGPPPMMDAVQSQLSVLKVDKSRITLEEFELAPANNL